MPVTSPMIQFVPKLRPDLIARRRPVWRAPLCVHEARRAFAVHHPNQASKAGVGQKMDFLPNKRQNIQESPKVQQKKGVRGLKDASKIPADLGLMPGTTRPTANRMLNSSSDTRNRHVCNAYRQKSSLYLYRTQISPIVGMETHETPCSGHTYRLSHFQMENILKHAPGYSKARSTEN